MADAGQVTVVLDASLAITKSAEPLSPTKEAEAVAVPALRLPEYVTGTSPGGSCHDPVADAVHGVNGLPV